MEIRLTDENGNDVAEGELGEVAIRGHNIMKGYYKKPEATAAAIRNGWFYSGDIGRLDEDGGCAGIIDIDVTISVSADPANRRKLRVIGWRIGFMWLSSRVGPIPRVK